MSLQDTVNGHEQNKDQNEMALQQDLGSKLWNLIENEKYNDAVKLLKDEKYHEYLTYHSLDLIPIISRVLYESSSSSHEECVEIILSHIASVANGKEALMAFLEQLEMNNSVQYFRVLLKPVQALLLREISGTTRPVLFSWVFNALYSNVVLLDLPKNYNLENKERKLMDALPEVETLTNILRLVIDFYQIFFDKVMDGTLVWGGKVENSKEYLACFLLQLFHKPITYLDVYCSDGEVESSLFRICDRLSGMIALLMGNTFKLLGKVKWDNSKTIMADYGHKTKNGHDTKLLDNIKDKNNEINNDSVHKEEEEETISQLSLACYFYCIVGQNMGSNYVPCVYSPDYLYIKSLPLIVLLLQEKDDLPIDKGLILARTLLNNIEEKTLSNESLEAKAHSSFPQLLIRIMVYCNNKELRTKALEIFRSYFGKFNTCGTRNLINGLLISVHHSGALSLVIYELKENVAKCIKEELDPNFSGKNLRKMVMLACNLPDRETTDLLEFNDSIMAALNLLLFIFLSDTKNKLDVKKILPLLKRDFLQCLETGLDMSKAHYKLRLQELSIPSKGEKINMNVCVGGLNLPNMPPQQEKSIIETALCSFDVMQCVLARVTQAAGIK